MSVLIGGDAGQGVESSGSSYSLAFARAGLHVFSVTDYRSRIRGGHNFYQIRLADAPIRSHRDPVHLMLALTRETIDVHLPNMAPGGGIIYERPGKRMPLPTPDGPGTTPYHSCCT